MTEQLDYLYPQATAGYAAEAPDTEQRCGLCAHFREGGCAIVAGDITDAGTCELWLDPDEAVDAANDGETPYDDEDVDELPDIDRPLPTSISDSITGGGVFTPSVSASGAMEMEAAEDAVSEIYESQFVGKIPTVPFAPGVNIGELTANDPDPFFVTLPIARVGAISTNKLVYTQELVQSIVQQVNADKPTGIRGHIKPEDRATAYPNPEVYWVGATLVGEIAYAKGYIPPGEAREEYRIRKATNAPAATSIYGKPSNVRPVGAGYTVDLVLEQIDLAPPKRASLFMGGQFEITSEMTEENDNMEREDMKKAMMEMSFDAIEEMMGPDYMDRMAEACASKRGKKIVTAEMAVLEASVLAEMQSGATTAQTTIAELTGAVDTLRKQVIGDRVTAQVAHLTDWRVATDDGKSALGELRAMLEQATLAEMAGSLNADDVPAAAQRAFATRKALAETVRDQLAGPRMPTLMGDGQKPGALSTPEQQRDAASRIGW